MIGPRLAKHGGPLLLLSLAALVATLPLIIHGCSCGHDFDFHLLNWIEAASQFSHGALHPHWAYTPAYNAGEPRFVFYPPISWYTGALLGLILTHLPRLTEAAAWTATPILFTWLALTASGLALYRLAHAFVPQNAALLAATLYLANPYMLFTAYERTAYAELLAAAWIPLLFLGILRERVTLAGIAIPLALLWLTNAPAAVMGSYTLALLAIIRLVFASRAAKHQGRPLLLAAKIAAGTLLGFALAAFYIVPAAKQRPFVHIAMLNVPGMRIQDNFLFERTGASFDQMAHDVVLHTASLVASSLIVVTAILLVALFARDRRRAAVEDNPESRIRLVQLSLAILAATLFFLLTPLSLTLWKVAPQASFLQFPWRLLAILASAMASAAALTLRPLNLHLATTCAAMLALALTLSFAASRFFRQRCFLEDTPAARLALFHSTIGTDPTDEYTPASADNDALTQNNPPYWLADTPDAAPPPATAPGSAPGPTPAHLSITVAHDEWAILNLRSYPAWQVTRRTSNTSQIAAQQPRGDGLIAFRIPAGDSAIDINYRGSSSQIEGDGITLIALPFLLFSLRRKQNS